MKFEEYIDTLIKEKVFPGVSILFSEKGKVLLYKNYGNLSLNPDKLKMVNDPIYDLASLTKPLVTSFLTLKMVEMNELSLQSKIESFFSGFDNRMEIKHLLTHTSGLPAWYPLYLSDSDYLNTIKNLKPISKPGRRVIYSCMGYILLGFILERIYGESLDKIADKIIFKPLKMDDSFFKIPSSKIERVAPTEEGNEFEKRLVEEKFSSLCGNFRWREKIIRGQVHDNNSFYLKRAAGNAGLFSTAMDIFKFSKEFFPDKATIIKPETVKLFWKNFTPFKRSSRTVGFKLNYSLSSSGGRALSLGAIGHNGFTGTSVWLENGRERVYIILSNRVHPQVDSSVNFDKIRRKIHYLIKRENI